VVNPNDSNLHSALLAYNNCAINNDKFTVYSIYIHLSIHPSGSLSGGLSVRPSIHPPQIIHPFHPDSLLCICLLISICIYMSECLFIYVSLPLYIFICLGIYQSLYMSMCLSLWRCRPMWPRVLPFSWLHNVYKRRS
jgi:hypothetical protein